MTQLLSQTEIDKTLEGITIPSRPQILQKLSAELAKDDPEPNAIVSLISVDAGLCGAVLKTVNSPFFGLSSKISSISNAVSLLGMKATGQIVTSLVVRNSVVGDARLLEHFWDTSEKLASISAFIATSMRRGPRDDAYSFGLFHDIGIPILMKKFPDFEQTLAMLPLARGRSMTSLEDERHTSNHAMLGYLIAKEWYLPTDICEAILYHHDDSIFQDQDAISPKALTLVAIARLADHLYDDNAATHSHGEWDRVGDQVLEHLEFSEGECIDLKDEMSNMLGQQA